MFNNQQIYGLLTTITLKISVYLKGQVTNVIS